MAYQSNTEDPIGSAASRLLSGAGYRAETVSVRRKRTPVARPKPVGYSTADVSRLCGVSLRQLQWWDERKVFHPAITRHSRIYSAAQGRDIFIVASLRRRGVTLQKVRRVIHKLKAIPPGTSYLLVGRDSPALYPCRDAAAVVEVLKDKIAALVLVDLRESPVEASRVS